MWGRKRDFPKHICGVYLEQYGMRVQGRLTELSQEVATPFAKRQIRSAAGLRKTYSDLERERERERER